MWFEKGGYRGEVDRNNLAERRVLISQILTFALAVGVTTPFLWYLVDLIRIYQNNYEISYARLLIFASGICTGILGLLIVEKVLKRK